MHGRHRPAQPDAFYSECMLCGHLITCASASGMHRVMRNGRPVWRVSDTSRTRIMQPYPWEQS